jgi:hypothetical protein
MGDCQRYYMAWHKHLLTAVHAGGDRNYRQSICMLCQIKGVKVDTCDTKQLSEAAIFVFII